MHSRPTEKRSRWERFHCEVVEDALAVARRAGLSPEKVRPQEGTSAVLNPLEAAYADRRIERFSHCVERSEQYYDALVADFRF